MGPCPFDIFPSFLEQSSSSDTTTCSMFFSKMLSSSHQKPAISLRNPDSFYWRMISGNQDLGNRPAHHHLVSLLLGPLSRRSKSSVSVFTYPPIVYLLIHQSSLFLYLSSINHLSISVDLSSVNHYFLSTYYHLPVLVSMYPSISI